MAWAKHAAGSGLTLEQIKDELPYKVLAVIDLYELKLAERRAS